MPIISLNLRQIGDTLNQINDIRKALTDKQGQDLSNYVTKGQFSALQSQVNRVSDTANSANSKANQAITKAN